jgi:hypothetical protein
MLLYQKICRCCGENFFKRLEVYPEISQFFLHYGLQISVEVESNARSLTLDKIEKKWPAFMPAIVSKLKRALNLQVTNNILVKMPHGLCSTCSYLAPWPEISDDSLLDYYSYYLTSDYKKARIRDEPSYAAIAPIHGSPQELLIRRNELTAFLIPMLRMYVKQKEIRNLRLLDYGGGDGGVQPILDNAQLDTYDIGDLPPPKNHYDLVQCMHVLEHVGNPYNVCLNAFDCCKTGGLLYIEVPLEFTSEEDCANGLLPIVSEHINKFSLKSIRSMLNRLDGNIIFLEEGSINVLHISSSARVIRGLIEKA